MDLKTYISGERGRAKALAAKIGISPSFLSQIARGTAPASPRRCVDIEVATDGQVTRRDMRDDWRDIWPEAQPASTANTAPAEPPG
jgi:DNA-binding transcriptional regulator YdaS (Cro superfamily)